MKKQIKIAIIGIFLVVLGFYVIKNFEEKSTKDIIIDREVKEFKIEAFRFGYSPDIIEVNEGNSVRIIINNTDTLHGIRIPELNVRGDELLEFTADKKGEFIWYCTNMCGDGHMQMQGKLVVR